MHPSQFLCSTSYHLQITQRFHQLATCVKRKSPPHQLTDGRFTKHPLFTHLHPLIGLCVTLIGVVKSDCVSRFTNIVLYFFTETQRKYLKAKQKATSLLTSSSPSHFTYPVQSEPPCHSSFFLCALSRVLNVGGRRGQRGKCTATIQENNKHSCFNCCSAQTSSCRWMTRARGCRTIKFIHIESQSASKRMKSSPLVGFCSKLATVLNHLHTRGGEMPQQQQLREVIVE